MQPAGSYDGDMDGDEIENKYGSERIGKHDCDAKRVFDTCDLDEGWPNALNSCKSMTYNVLALEFRPISASMLSSTSAIVSAKAEAISL